MAWGGVFVPGISRVGLPLFYVSGVGLPTPCIPVVDDCVVT
jgi:hypothetical protein